MADYNSFPENPPQRLLNELLDDLGTFRSSGVHGLEWPKKTICVVIHEDDMASVRIFRNDSRADRHAEEEVIDCLKTEGKTRIYTNWSPCDGCSQLFLEWIQAKGRNAELTLKYAGLYFIERQSCLDNGCTHRQTYRRENRNRLSDLCYHAPNMTVGPFEEKDWVDLYRCLHWKSYREDYSYKQLQTSFEKEDEATRHDHGNINCPD